MVHNWGNGVRDLEKRGNILYIELYWDLGVPLILNDNHYIIETNVIRVNIPLDQDILIVIQNNSVGKMIGLCGDDFYSYLIIDLCRISLNLLFEN